MRVVAGLVHVSHHAGQFIGVEVDLGELLPRQVALDRDGREARGGIDVADDAPAAFERVGDQLAQKVERLVQILGLVANHQHTETGPVAGDDHAVAVADDAARGRNQTEVELAGGGEGGVFLGLDDLQLAEARGQAQYAQPGQTAQHEGAPQEGALPLIDVRKEDRGFAHRNRTSPSSNRWIRRSASGKIRSVGTI